MGIANKEIINNKGEKSIGVEVSEKPLGGGRQGEVEIRAPIGEDRAEF